jgi:adenosylcobinamide-phosphate synthase
MFSWLIVQISILFVALALDITLGEPPAAVHPVVWIGKVVSTLERSLYGGTESAQRFKGVALVTGLIVIFIIPVALFQLLGYQIASGNIALMLGYVALSAYLLKASFTIFTLQKEAIGVTDQVYTNLDAARRRLCSLVSRERSQLDEEQVLSGVCESVGENTVDSIVAPLLFFAVFGVAGALCYRVVNTLDSMLGYKDHRKYIGTFSARLDDVLNYIPTRLAIVPMLLGFRVVCGRSAYLEAWNVLKADRHKKPAVNSGIPVALFAGGLGVRLTKPSSYVIGDGRAQITKATVNLALSVMMITSVLTISFVVLLLYGKALV